MDVREKLVEFLNNSFVEQYEKRGLLTAQHTATDLIANGVTVQDLDGCEYCNDGSIIYNEDEEFYISGNMMRVDIGCHCYGQVEIKFCPMCGRRLPQPPKGE